MAHADPRLSRYDPLDRIIYFDDFDEGYNGWVGLIGNYEGSLDTMLPGYQQLMQPMLSNVTHWDTGSHGAFDGTYCLKTATRPVKGQQNVTLKRITFRELGRIQFECYFAFKPEANRGSGLAATWLVKCEPGRADNPSASGANASAITKTSVPTA